MHKHKNNEREKCLKYISQIRDTAALFLINELEQILANPLTEDSAILGLIHVCNLEPNIKIDVRLGLISEQEMDFILDYYEWEIKDRENEELYRS